MINSRGIAVLATCITGLVLIWGLMVLLFEPNRFRAMYVNNGGLLGKTEAQVGRILGEKPESIDGKRRTYRMIVFIDSYLVEVELNDQGRVAQATATFQDF